MSTNLISLSSIDLTSVVGGVGGGANRDSSSSSGFGAVYSGTSSARTNDAYRLDSIQRACDKQSTGFFGGVDQAKSGQCFLNATQPAPSAPATGGQ